MAVAMTEKDERDFLQFLRSTADIRIFNEKAASPELLTLEELPPRSSGVRQVFIWNVQFPWTLRVEPTKIGTCFVKNYASGPVIGYYRDSLGSPPFNRGSIFWPTSPDPEMLQANPQTPYCYDHDAFRPWYEKIVRWVLNNGRRGWGKNRQYYLPDAWRRHGWYRL